MAASVVLLRELQGLYGPVTIAERVVQKIWLRRDFDQRDLRLVDGQSLVIRAVGTWNMMGGPDFRGARLEIDGVATSGDIEVHFRVGDWQAHRHARDLAYDNVILHVLLFPPGPDEAPARHRSGKEIPTLVLLPLLHRGLEEYASDDALERMTNQDVLEKIIELASKSKEDVVDILSRHAGLRWEMKVRFARLRIQKLGWREAAHTAALEVLGYRRNRVPMLITATVHPLSDWEFGFEVGALLAEGRSAGWVTQGIRPANQPLRRLRQYAVWVASVQNWPDRWREATGEMGAHQIKDEGGSLVTSDFRRLNQFPKWRQRWAKEICGGVVGGSRFDTLICDALLPLCSAETGFDAKAWWFHWPLGDIPDEVRKALVALGVAGTRSNPSCHGMAQGFLGWMADREARASC